MQECGNRISCESCVKGGDPYCAGWCTLHATLVFNISKIQITSCTIMLNQAHPV
jgi:hypothetical protein